MARRGKLPTDELNMFRQNLSYARDLVETAVALSAHVTAAVRMDDVLRSALVHGVSALDHYVHEEVRARMMLTQQGKHPRAQGYDRFRVSLASVDSALTLGSCAWLESEIREQHGYLSFQTPDKIADAFRLVTDVKLWQAVGDHLGIPPEAVKRKLKLIVDRRNKIAHEADIDPTPPRIRYPIDETLVRDSLDFIESIVDALISVT